jgi:hypothetical protein
LKEEEKKCFCVILPTNKFIQVWHFIVSILLCFTAIYVPFKVSFIDESSPVQQFFDFLVDGLFALDIIITFFTAIE